MIWIASMGEDGIRIDAVGDFAAWVRERTDGIRPECQPVFLNGIPAQWRRGQHMESEYECVVIRGEVVVPKAVSVVTEYVLPEAVK